MEHIPGAADETREISLRLEKYDDIFSDFDIRHYSKRSLSIDFLDEIKRASQDKDKNGVELVLFAPEKERNESREAVIRERLAAHFKRHHDLLVKEKRRVRRFGMSMVSLGILAMVAASLIVFRDPADDLVLSFLVVFLEPAAWFLLWEGMDQVIFTARNINPDLEFYRKMSAYHGRIHFKSY